MIKKLLIFLIVLSITIPFADAVPLSDKTGLKFTFPVKTDGHTFVVEATGNLDVTNLDFDKDKKMRSVQTIIFHQVLRRDLCYVSEN